MKIFHVSTIRHRTGVDNYEIKNITIDINNHFRGFPMKKLAFALGISLLPVSAYAQDDNKLEATMLDQTIAATYKRCLQNPAKKEFTKEEMENYCGCWAVKLNERVPRLEWEAAMAAGTWLTHPVNLEITNYCRSKYLNLPDVSAIRKKQW